MNIPSLTGATRTPSSTAEGAGTPTAARVAEGAARPAASDGENAQDPPAPPRFPWLSRLALQLESAARQKASFAQAPVLGDHIDKSA